MVLDFGEEEEFALFKRVSEETDRSDAFFRRLREKRSMFNTPDATANNILRTEDALEIISGSKYFFPDKGFINFKYTIDWNVNNEIGEWADDDGIFVGDLRVDVLKRGDGGVFPKMYGITLQVDAAHNVEWEGPPGGDPYTLTTDMNNNGEVVDLEAPLSDEVVVSGNFDSIESINSLWMHVDVNIFSGAGNTEVKLQTSINGSDWNTHHTTCSNVDFVVNKNVKDVSMKFFRVLLTAAVNDQHIKFNMVAWKNN